MINKSQMTSPHISVVIPAFNREHEIYICLNAIAHSTYTDYEIIVCDDSSNDNTSDIAPIVPTRSSKFCLPNKYIW